MNRMKKWTVTCPYCGKPAKLVDSIEIYKTRSYGKAYLCKECDAYVGCHKGTDRPLGRLANAELRMWKQRAHAAFDILWQTKEFDRKSAYAWLADKLDIPIESCHIGMFDVDRCQQVIEVSLAYLQEKNCKTSI